MIVFLDLETTGLDVDNDQILEVGILVTDDDLVVRGGAQQVVRPIINVSLDEFVLTLDPIVQKMHAENGLWKEVESDSMRRHEAETDLVAWLEKFREGVPGYPMKFVLAGNSVWFDLMFLRKNMPTLASMFDRRLIDVTSVNLLASRWAKATFEGRPSNPVGANKHRALADANHSRDVLAYYRDNEFLGISGAR